jgi:hypothetical protein
MDNKTYALCEAVADLSAMFALSPTLPGDSREMCRLCIQWADAFQQKNDGREWDGEYYDELEVFFEEAYAEWLATDTDTRENDALTCATDDERSNGPKRS